MQSRINSNIEHFHYHLLFVFICRVLCDFQIIALRALKGHNRPGRRSEPNSPELEEKKSRNRGPERNKIERRISVEKANKEMGNQQEQPQER